jgi:uncharacterized membrane protein YjjP (DUF1212 family)
VTLPTTVQDAQELPPPVGDSARILRLALRIAAAMLGSGAQTEDAEAAVGSITRGLGLQGVQAAVTFSTLSVSHTASGSPPITLLYMVRDREADFSHLADLSSLARSIGRGEIGLEAAEEDLQRLAAGPSTYPPLITFSAAGLSAMGATLMFGGSIADAAATLAIALAVQPALAALDRSSLPPFFRVAFGAAASTFAVALLVGLGLSINGGLVLTGSLLRFLPGYALVSGFRDLIDQSIVSGTARLAEALLLGAAVAGGVALGVTVAANADVRLSIVSEGATDWGLVVSTLAALLAVGAFAIRLGVPRRSVPPAAVIGAVGWLLYLSVTPPSGAVDPGLATLAASILLGMIGRVMARHYDAPAALWVVPAVLPLLPGLQIVTAMLAPTDVARVAGLIGAAVTAFLIGTGVASGDIAVSAIRRARERFVAPAVGAVADGVEVFVVRPVERFVGHVRDDGAATDSPTTDAGVAVEAPDPPEASAPPAAAG